MHLLTQSALLRALGWSLFNSLWQMSLLWAFYHFVLLVFKNLPARARHGLALFLLTAGFIWSVISFSAWGPAGGGLPFPAHNWVTTTLDRGHWLAELILPWCSSLYLLTLAVLLVHYSRQYIYSKRISRDGLLPLAPAFDVFVSSTARRMGIGAKVRAHLSSLVEAPVTLGFLKPIILLPVSMVTQLTTAQIEAILVHELAHIRRKDYLLNLVVTVMELLYFFNPFARRLIAELKKEREHCCDDTVLEFRYDPHAYVTALLSLARQHRQTHLAVAAIGGGEQLLLQRARKILQQKRTDDRPGPRPIIGLLLTALVSILVLGHSRTAGTTVQRPAFRFSPAVQPVALLESTHTVLLNNRPHRSLANPAPIGSHHHPASAHHTSHAIRHSQDLAGAIRAESANGSDPAVFVLNTARPAYMPVSSFTGSVDTALRDYSMRESNGNQDGSLSDPNPVADNMPFVPQSSFAFQYTDTLPPGEKLALMQELSQKAVQLQISRVRLELKQQRLLLHEQDKSIDTRVLQPLLQQQLQVRQQYIINLEKLERQLQKASRRLTIVYI
jgi:beta-lactamase regulating signal transducer with metallopeptidase domain